MSDPDLTTEIVGYRQWRVTPELCLRAAAHREHATWTPGVNEAVCRRIAALTTFSYSDESARIEPCGDTPGQECECGFYALHGPSDFWYGNQGQNQGLWAGFAISATDADPLVSGVIVGWGKVQVHHQGFRAQFARIVALALPESKRDAVVTRAVAAAYGVPCVPVDELPRIAAEFGSTVPAEMRPEKPEPKQDLLTATWGQLYTQYVGGGYVAGNTLMPAPSGHYFTPPSYLTHLWTPAPSPPKAPRPQSRFERKQSNRQGPGGKRRGPKNIDPRGSR